MKAKLILLIICIFYTINVFSQKNTLISFNLGSAIDLSKQYYITNDILALDQRGIVVYGLEIEKKLSERFSLSIEPTKTNRLLQFKAFDNTFSKFKLGYFSLPILANFSSKKTYSKLNFKLVFGIGISSNFLFSKQINRSFNTNEKNYVSFFDIDYKSNFVPGFISNMGIEKKLNDKNAIGIVLSYHHISGPNIALNSSFEYSKSNITSSFQQTVSGKNKLNFLQLKLKYYFNV